MVLYLLPLLLVDLQIDFKIDVQIDFQVLLLGHHLVELLVLGLFQVLL